MPVYSTNPNASRNYAFEEFFEAGLSLLGSEVKSIKQGKYSIKESYVLLKRGELFIVNSYIPKYSNSSFFTHDETRDRKLLLRKAEIRKLIGKVKIKGYALIPTKVYSKKNLVKIEIGLGKGKKLYDKRVDIKKKDLNREIRRDFKSKLSI
ncbi:MAG: SsrA-binding protein SmpB [Deltaproteobacteria bacterium TMED126]|jgi:SsrA-binding protein|nr:SsrA-binding protein SmpB [Candidatus Dadabacteria bacterium]NSW97413.1 SsrA-binding protein SmpB [Deltaproteobacteria bacterium TMED126]NSW98745.1 SsrA-binding protein SmpB [bacterium]|tara:strand:+ start:1268 stop:1720 length:453 start_codon:yes stop_codon:yes gene_type:complete